MTVTRRGGRAKGFLRGLLKLLAIVVVAGGVGFALGTWLSTLSEGDATTAPVADAGTAAPPGRSSGATLASPSATTPTPTAPPTAPAARTTTTPGDAPSPFAQVRVSVLDARLFTDGTPSGRRDQRARVTVRLRAENAGGRSVILPPAILRVGSVRVPAHADAGSRFDPLAAGASQTVTLRFPLAAAATPKVVRDRRARILIAGRSVALRVTLRSPTR